MLQHEVPFIPDEGSGHAGDVWAMRAQQPLSVADCVATSMANGFASIVTMAKATTLARRVVLRIQESFDITSNTLATGDNTIR